MSENKKDYTTQSSALESARNFVLILLIGVLCFYALISNTKNQGQMLPMIFGKGCAVVMTGSMEPTIPVDAMIFVDEQDSYAANEIVVIQSGRSLVVHRIISIDNNEVITKGDANNTEDKPVPVSSIRGRVIGHIPYVGSAVRFMKTPFGSLILIGVVMLLWVSMNKSTDEVTDNDEENPNTENDGKSSQSDENI